MKHSIKRKLVQIAAFGINNANIPNFFKGTIYKGSLKSLCVPGLNCYSCPGAVGSCPIGSLQAVMGSYKYNFSFYVVGILLAFGVVFGRFICGFLCPFGLIQELLHKIPLPKISLPKGFRYVKYGVLAVFVIAMPLLITNFMGIGQPAFCQYICPAGTLEGGIPLLLANSELQSTIGWLFFLKLFILIVTIVGSMLVFRVFCRILCPLGAIYALCNRISLYQIRLDKDACHECGKCARVCKMGVDPVKQPNSAECIRCGDCVAACPSHALKAGFGVRWRGDDKTVPREETVSDAQQKPGTRQHTCQRCSRCEQ